MTEENQEPSIILFADDEPAGREAIKGLLFLHGYRLIEAEDGLQAIQQAHLHMPDLILLDVMMPGLDGYAVCRRLRSDPLLRDVPILIITALDDRDSRLRGIEAGADDFISKPFDRIELRARVRTITRLNRYRRLLAEGQQVEEERANYSRQLNELSNVSIQIGAKLDQEEILQITVHSCQKIIAARFGLICLENRQRQTVLNAVAIQDGNDFNRSLFEGVQQTFGAFNTFQQLARGIAPCRHLRDELKNDPFWQNLKSYALLPDIPWNGYIAAPLSSRTEQGMGFLILFDKLSGTFSENDLSILTQIAQMASVALEKARLIYEVQQASDHIRDLARQVVTAQEKERQFIARELHDESGQELTVLKLTLQMAIDDLPEELAAVRDQLSGMVQLTEELSMQIRSLAHSLRPPRFDLGLNASLEGLCMEYVRSLKIPVNYQGTGQTDIPELVAITVYRLLQESLTNIARHAKATQVIVHFDVQNGYVELTVADNGRGFNPDQVQRTEGAGLRGMRERLELLNGTLSIQSFPNHGTTIIVRVPWSEEK